MPQMKPMNWIFLFFYILIMFIMMNNNLYFFNYNKFLLKNFKNLNYFKFKMKW